MNKTLKLLILSDIFMFSGFGLIGPIFAIFIKDNLVGGTITAAGLASTIFLITHAVLQLIFAKVFNPKDRFWMLILGTVMIVMTPFFFIFSTNIWHIYIAQFIHGVGAGFAFPAWSSLFTSNLEKGKRGLQWSMYSSSVGLGTAITAYLGAIMAQSLGFKLVFSITGLATFVGLLILFGLDRKNLIKKI